MIELDESHIRELCHVKYSPETVMRLDKYILAIFPHSHLHQAGWVYFLIDGEMVFSNDTLYESKIELLTSAIVTASIGRDDVALEHAIECMLAGRSKREGVNPPSELDT